MSVPDSLRAHPPDPPDDEDEAREADEFARLDRLDDYTPATAVPTKENPMTTFRLAYLLVLEVDAEDRESAELEARGVVDALDTSREDVRIVSSDDWAGPA